MAEQTKAQKKRAEARERRRGQPPEDQSRENQDDGALAGNEEQPLDAVKQAAKVAVAGAAVGAAAAAARALTSRHDDDSEPEPTSEPQAEQDQEPERQQEPEPEKKPAEQQPQNAMREQQDGTQERQDGTQERQDGTQEPEAQDAAPRVQSREERHGAAPDDAKATVKQAREQLEALLELPVESVSGFERTRNGWLVTPEVLELSRIPESTDVLASYEMELDDDRNLVRYIRGRRYHRSQADRGDQS